MREWDIMGRALVFIEKLGQGSFGEVELVEHCGEHRAFKRMHPTASLAQGNEVRKMLREAVHLGAVHHENVIRFFGVCREPDCLGILMEYAEKGSLRRFVDDNPQLDRAVQMRLLQGVVEAIEASGRVSMQREIYDQSQRALSEWRRSRREL